MTSHPTPSEIRAFRQARGLTLQQAGELLRTGKRTWEDWESGRRRMPWAKWELIQINNGVKK